MTDSPRRDRADPSQPSGYGYPAYPDPAYASQTPYGPPYQPPSGPSYDPYGYDPQGYHPYATGQYSQGHPAPPPSSQPPEPKSPRWLWAVAGLAVLIVIGLVIALVIANSSRQQTVVAPAPALPEAASTTTTRPTTTPPTRTPTLLPIPMPTVIEPPTAPTSPSGLTETVTYDVTGEGRVINITYTDTGGVPQTEFNVALPWSKQVELPAPAQSTARISIINVGRDVACSLTIAGQQVEQQTGSGLTFCVGSG